MATVPVNGTELYYEVHGQGEPLLLIMGLGANATAWVMQIPEFSQQYQVIAFDNRGSGRSGKPEEVYSITQMADDAAMLMDHREIDSAHVFGMFMGGMIAQELTLRHPFRVRSLILGGTMAGGPLSVLAGPRLIQQWIAAAALPLPKAIDAGLGFLYSDSFLEANRERLIERALVHAQLLPPAHALQKQIMAVIAFNAYGRLQEVRVPTLVMTGTHDKIVPAGNSQLLVQRIRGAQLIEFPGAGHGFLVEKATDVNAAVLHFLRQHRMQSAIPA